ncbi:MAG: right-handed parallel beta-helix repeat-containing protein [Verrucomicrobiota bacterium]
MKLIGLICYETAWRMAGVGALLCGGLVVTASARELWVQAGAAAGGVGSPAQPFATISAAAKSVLPGDTILVRQGTYAETVTLQGAGTPEKPIALRAAPGERVVLSGFTPIQGWQREAGEVYSATIEGPIADLYVGLTPQPVSRWPGAEQPMRSVKEPDAGAATFKDGAGPGTGWPAEVVARPQSLMAFVYVARGNYFSTVGVKGLEAAGGVVKLGDARVCATLQGKGGRYQLVNHPRLITQVGQWAFVELDAPRVRVYFRPAAVADLERTQYRRAAQRLLLVSGREGHPATQITVAGLEVCGSGGVGVEVTGASHVNIQGCIVHNNQRNGISVRRCEEIQLQNNIVVANANGVGVISSKNVLVQQNEIALNLVDGVDIAGNVSGKPDGEPESQDITVRRNYIHHHLLLGHPDNLQTYRGVHRLVVEDNVLLWGGQGIMTEEIDGSTIRNSIIVGTAAIAVIFGHGNSHDWTIEQSTIGLGGYGAFSFTGHQYRLNRSIVWNNPLTLAETLTSQENLLYQQDAKLPIYLVTKPKWRSLFTPEEAAALGREAHSRRANPQFRAAPLFQAAVRWDDANTRSRLTLRAPAKFEIGDQIEINGDGLLRRVTKADENVVQFEPPLPAAPFRDALIWNWKQAATTTLDLRPTPTSPALAIGPSQQPCGANLDIPAFQRGDFNQTGKRELPELPSDLKHALPNPNAIVLPLHGN